MDLPLDTMDSRTTLRMIEEDCLTDARTLDGMPFTGRTIGQAIGNLIAMVLALTKVVESLLPEEPS